MKFLGCGHKGKVLFIVNNMVVCKSCYAKLREQNKIVYSPL